VPARWRRTRADCRRSFQPNRRERYGSAGFSHRKRPWGSRCGTLLSICSRCRCSRSRYGRARCTTISHCLSTRWVERARDRDQKIDAIDKDNNRMCPGPGFLPEVSCAGALPIAGPAAYLEEALEEPTARSVAERVLNGVIDLVSDPNRPRTCLWDLQAPNCCASTRCFRGPFRVPSNYSVYSIKDGSKNGPRRISELHSQASTRLTHKSCIFNRRIIFQAVGRGSDSRLPLQTFQNQ